MLTAKDFKSDQEVRWCPGCGDYAILAAMQSFLPELGVPRENLVFVSGIGCAARFPYYLNAYGMHSIHGRAAPIASGLAVSRPDLSVWVVTGDGDALSIGGNHLLHALRRNVNIRILLFNNQVYGLTKGQYSPTSPVGQVTGPTPMGSIDWPLNPISVALGAEATFVARSIDTDRAHLTEMLRAAVEAQGRRRSWRSSRTATSTTTARSTTSATRRRTGSCLEDGEPIRFGAEGERGVRLGSDGAAELVDVAEVGEDALMVHDVAAAQPTHRVRAGRGSAIRFPARCRSACSAPSSGRRTTTSWQASSPARSRSRARAIWSRCSTPGTPGRSLNSSAARHASHFG